MSYIFSYISRWFFRRGEKGGAEEVPVSSADAHRIERERQAYIEYEKLAQQNDQNPAHDWRENPPDRSLF